MKAKSVHFTVTSQMVANVDPQNEFVPKTDFAELNMGLKAGPAAQRCYVFVQMNLINGT